MKKLLCVFAGLAFALTAAAQEFRITHGPDLCDLSQDGVRALNEAGIDLMRCGHGHLYPFPPAGERNARSPIVANDNRSHVRCAVADGLIRIRIVGPCDKTTHTHEFSLKPQF